MAQRFVGVHEVAGGGDHPLVQYAFSLCDGFGLDTPDATPWCSAFANLVAFLTVMPRSKKASARSWLAVGARIALADATPGYDVVILQRGDGPQPGPEVLDAQGHVGFYAGVQDDRVLVLGGNQGDAVNVSAFPKARILAIQRLLV